jgi:hypothetical protein
MLLNGPSIPLFPTWIDDCLHHNRTCLSVSTILGPLPSHSFLVRPMSDASLPGPPSPIITQSVNHLSKALRLSCIRFYNTRTLRVVHNRTRGLTLNLHFSRPSIIRLCNNGYLNTSMSWLVTLSE